MTTAFPAPATYLPSSVRRGSIDQPTDPFAIPNNQPRDSRVQWAQRTEATLKQEKQAVTKEMNRNRDLYDGKQWTGQRAPWKNQSVVNYCVAEGEKVATNEGLINIENVRCGTETPNGRVNAFFYQGMKPTVTVKTKRGLRVTCTPDHKVMTEHGWVLAQDLLGKRIVMQAPVFAKDYVVEGGIRIDEDWGRWLGYFMGDGCCYAPKGNLNVTCDARDQDTVTDVERLMNGLLAPYPSARYNAKIRNSGATVIQEPHRATVVLYRKKAVEAMQSLGTAERKRIVCVPDSIFRSPRSVVREFLRGLFESDGSIPARYSTVTLTSKSREFLADVNVLLMGFGIVGARVYAINGRAPNGTHTYAYNLVMALNDAQTFGREIGFISARKSNQLAKFAREKKHFNVRDYDLTDEVIAVDDAGMRNVFDISIDDDRHQFAANGIVVSNCAWVVDHWTAVLADNKPKPTWEAHRPNDQWQADIMTASWNQDSTDFGYQQEQEDAIQNSRISKIGYIYQTYDPYARRPDGTGGIVFRALDGIDVYVDKDASDIQKASIVMIERREPIGDILFRYKHLRTKLNIQGNDLQSNNGSGPVNPAPPQKLYSNQSPTGMHVPPYYAPSAKMTNDGGTGGVKVLEFFTFPRGPDAQTEISRFRFTADHRMAFKRKMIEFDDGVEEPLQTVLTEGGIMYELPMSTASAAKYAAEAFGGIDIIRVDDALEPQRERITVPLYPQGRRTVVIGDHVADDGCNPFGHGRVPLAPYHAYRKGNGFYGYSDIDRIASQQEYLNRLYALLIDAAILTSNPTWLIPTDAQIADEDITNAPGAIIRGDGMMLKMARREPGPSMPQYVMGLLQFTIQQIREISGLSESSTGGKFKGQVAAETVSMYQEQAGIRFRQGQRNVEAAEVEIGVQYQANVGQFYTEPRLIKLKDAQGIEKPIMFVGMDLGAPMRVMVKPGSQLPASPSARLNLVMSLITSPIPAFDLPTFWRHLQEVGIIESASALENTMRGYMANPKDLWLAPSLLQMLNGGQKKNKGGSKKSNGGKSARASTSAGAARNAAA